MDISADCSKVQYGLRLVLVTKLNTSVVLQSIVQVVPNTDQLVHVVHARCRWHVNITSVIIVISTDYKQINIIQGQCIANCVADKRTSSVCGDISGPGHSIPRSHIRVDRDDVPNPFL